MANKSTLYNETLEYLGALKDFDMKMVNNSAQIEEVEKQLVILINSLGGSNFGSQLVEKVLNPFYQTVIEEHKHRLSLNANYKNILKEREKYKAKK